MVMGCRRARRGYRYESNCVATAASSMAQEHPKKSRIPPRWAKTFMEPHRLAL